ncbi:hypothetical protein Tco_1288543 [Tanacetum coccineum]
MSDSEDSTVTYTAISSPYEDPSDMGSPGVEGPIFQDPPSLDYVPGPEEPEQAPPSPIYIPFSPGYIPESDPKEDPEEDDKEDPEEDPADYPADRGDDRDDEESSDDDDDDDDDAEEEEHLAPADPVAVAFLVDQDPYLAYRITARTSIRPQAPAPQRDALPSPVHETEIPEICLPLRKRLCHTAPTLGYEVGESSAAGAARQHGPATAGADLYGFADMLDAAPGRQRSSELGYDITDTWDPGDWTNHPRGGQSECY